MDDYESCIGIPESGVAVRELLPGAHSVGFAYLPAGCTVTPQPPIEVAVTLGDTTEVAFTVTCT
jgi:hypothetical protein